MTFTYIAMTVTNGLITKSIRHNRLILVGRFELFKIFKFI